MPKASECVRLAETLMFIQLLLSLAAIWIMCKSASELRKETGAVIQQTEAVSRQAVSSEPTFCSLKATAAPVSTTGSVPSPSFLSTVCSQLMTVQQLSAANDVNNINQKAIAAGATVPPSTVSQVSEGQALGFLIPILTTLYLVAYNLFWRQTFSTDSPSSNNDMCLWLLQKRDNDDQYEALSGDIQGYAAIGQSKAALSSNIKQALMLVYFVARVRIFQVQNATVDLSDSIVYDTTTNTIKFSSSFAQMTVSQLGPLTAAVIKGGSTTPEKLVAALLGQGEQSTEFQRLMTGKSHRFICGGV